ncbi:MAG: hypothetical protein ACRDNL_15585 [Spirillospora sp.]
MSCWPARSAALGPDRLAAEEAAADELARLCGHLPLALRVAAANTPAAPAGTIAGGIARLDHGDRPAAPSPEGEEEERSRRQSGRPTGRYTPSTSARPG